MKTIPSIRLPIINNGEISNHVLSEITANKKIIIFDVSGIFTPTCSEQQVPSFLNLIDQLNYILSKIPRNRFEKVEELTSIVAWKVSEENSFTTGAVFDLSGGSAT